MARTYSCTKPVVKADAQMPVELPDMKPGRPYWYVRFTCGTEAFAVQMEVWCGKTFDVWRWATGNFFKSEAEAVSHAETIKTRYLRGRLAVTSAMADATQSRKGGPA